MSIEFDTFTMSGMNQARLLAAIYRDEKLYLSAKRIGLKAGDFALKSCATLYGILENYRSKYGKMPSMATLQDLVISKMHEDGDDTEEDAREMCSVLNELVAETVLDYRYACDKLVEFTRAARVGQQIAADPNDTNAIIAAAQEAAMVRLEDLDGGEGKGRQVSLLEDGLALLPQKKAERDMKIPTGVTWLDFVTNGGLSVTNNEIGVGMAGTGVGKTNMMINFAISAAIAGFNVNFITLELTKKEIVRRALGMMAHIKTSEMRLPVEEWSPKSKERLDYLIHSSLRSRIRISDMSDKSYSVSDLVGEIERWKRETKEATGDDSKCRLVIIDWLDMLVPEAKDAKMINQQWQALQKVMEDVKHMANNQDVAVWTVMQTNRQGSGTNKVRLDHVSGAFSKNFFAALVIGLAPTGDEDDDDVISQDLTDGDLKGKLNTECDRTLHMNIIKNRDGVQREADIYQGPTLRFWRSKSDWLTTAKFLESGDMKKIFGKELKK